MTTVAHEFAASLIFTSGIIHYADTPEIYSAFPEEAQAMMRDAPACWEETCCLIGEPGRLVVLARRAGDAWFIADINGQTKKAGVDLDLAAFADFKKRTLIREGGDASMQLAAKAIGSGKPLSLTLPGRGGFVLRLSK